MENKTTTRKRSTKTTVNTEEKVTTTEKHVVYGTIVNCDNLNVRTEPNTSAAVASIFCAGTKLLVKSVLDGWYEVEGGYVKSDYIQLGE